MKIRVALLVAAVWVLFGVVIGAQSALGASLQGRPLSLADALRSSLVQSLPWIPVTLAVIAITVRFPLDRRRGLRHAPVHLLAVPVVAFVANVLVVLGFWALEGTFGGWKVLVQQAALWAVLRLHVALLIYGAIAGLTQVVVYYRDARERELHLARLESQLSRARLQALNAQIRPHFLFNTLHTIGQLWRSGQSDDADAVLDRLGALFHRVQDSSTQSEVPLADELELVREYLSIEQARFRDRLRVNVHASPAALRCHVPPLILQPVVENAIRHGISATSSAGTIDVTAEVERGLLALTVRDDGPGFPADPSGIEKGTGLSNTRERLAQLYGAGAVMRWESAATGGATVRIELPARDGKGLADA